MEKPSLNDFLRLKRDQTPDSAFYAHPRLVYHVDDHFRARLTRLYGEKLNSDMKILDLMSSWVSHLPNDVKYKHVEGHGMNQEELSQNKQLNHFFVQDLNANPKLPFDDASFNAVLIAVSVQYLQYPEKITKEISRILDVKGQCIISFSNRMFPTKAIHAWTQADDSEHVRLVHHYLQEGGFKEIDVIEEDDYENDPFFALIATKT
eukprot:TRINITY_DN1968_c0_g1_i1.p1 TRINITY_DN1968_c0_g1~~TRINITY_DN1968_c0_g1_i1.p1  ORF type:complete len:206 (-),score=41.57 TRINITY_DN1968_c0_g1_i1:12-629(-)